MAGGGTSTLEPTTCVSNDLPWSVSDWAMESGKRLTSWVMSGRETKVPRPCACLSRPSSARILMAWRAVPRAMSKWSMSWCSEGIFSPGSSSWL